MSERLAAAGTTGARGRSLPGHLQRPGSTRTLESTGDGAQVRRTVLPGGLRVITERVPGVRSASVGIWVSVGSRDEQPKVAGAAHYLEHLLFKATRRRTAVDFAEEIDAVGGELNAFTAKEHTCYYAHVLDEDLPLAVDLVTDVVFDATLAASDVEVERGVVLEEIAMRDDDPEDLLGEAFAVAMLGEHPLGRSVLGSQESITAMTPAALRRFYRTRYTPPRMVLAVAGNVEHAQVLRLVRKALRERRSTVDDVSAPSPPRAGLLRPRSARRLVLHSDDTEQAHLMVGTPALDRHDPRRYTLGVLNAALGGGMSSRLFQEVRERRGLAYQVYSSLSSYADTGHLTIYAGCQPERLGDVVTVVREILAEVAANGLSEAEVERGRGQLRGGFVLGMEDTFSRMARIGKGELNYGGYDTVERTLARIESVTVADVATLAQELLTVRPRSVAAAVVGPYARPGDLPSELHEVIGQ
ncbi:MAG: M16 family metallopeptidase [Sciscionella sp.]